MLSALGDRVLGGTHEPFDLIGVMMTDHLRETKLGVRLSSGVEADLSLGIGMQVGPSAEPKRVVALPSICRSCHACSTDRGVPTVLSPPSTTSARNPPWRARSTYDRQYSIGCFVVRNGTIRSRGTSCPRFVTRCRRLSPSTAPTAPSVRNTNVP
jgi:hypothetical protein